MHKLKNFNLQHKWVNQSDHLPMQCYSTFSLIQPKDQNSMLVWSTGNTAQFYSVNIQ